MFFLVVLTERAEFNITGENTIPGLLGPGQTWKHERWEFLLGRTRTGGVPSEPGFATPTLERDFFFFLFPASFLRDKPDQGRAEVSQDEISAFYGISSLCCPSRCPNP